MPLDGSRLSDLQLARLLEAAMKPPGKPHARAKRQRKRKTAAQTRAQALASILVLDRLAELLGAQGQHWIQNDYKDGNGGYCLLGGLQHVRAGSKASGDRAGVYLSRAIERVVGMRARLTGFNDGCIPGGARRQFAHIRPVIARARELAEQDMYQS